MPGSSVRKTRNPLGGSVARVKFTIGAEATNVIRATAALKVPMRADQAPAIRQHARVYLTQNLTTLAVAAVAPSGTVVVGGGKGAIIVSPTAKLIHDCTFDANGELALDITEAGVATWYLVVVIAGDVYVSPAITFA
jgi:hypothetical protein